MIFPFHRIKEQLKRQADLTEGDASSRAQALASQAQGVIAEEDFYLLGHRLVQVGNQQIAVAGQFDQNIFLNQPAAAIAPATAQPVQIILTQIETDVLTTLEIFDPVAVAAAGFGFQQASYTDMTSYFNQPFGTGILVHSGISWAGQRSAAAKLGASISVLPAGIHNVRWVIREGWGVGVGTFVVNQALSVNYVAREVDLRVR